MAYAGNILFLGGDDTQRKVIQAALKQACAGHESWVLAEDRTTSSLTLSCNETRVYSFAFRSLPEKSDEYREVVADASVVLLVCMVDASGEPPQDVRQALEVLRQAPGAPTVYPLLLLGTEPTSAERARLKWSGMILSLAAPAESPYGMNALLARCQPWMARGEAQPTPTLGEGTSPSSSDSSSIQTRGFSWTDFFFSFEGRMSPRAWFFANFVMAVVGLVLTCVFINIVSHAGEAHVLLVGIPLYVAWICALFTTTVRRLHDIGASGILLLPGIFASIVGTLVPVVTGDTIIIVERTEWSSMAWLMAECAVALVYLFVLLWPGDSKGNKYGEPPER